MTIDEIMIEVKKYGNEQTKKVLLKNGANPPLFGVKVGDLKRIQKKVKKEYELSKALFETGNYDCMYLAGLIADEGKMTKADLENWMANTTSHPIAEYTVAWIASESDYGLDLALKWIDMDDELYETAGWSILTSLTLIDQGIDIPNDKWSELIERVVLEIGDAKNRVRYTMNNFIIGMGGYNEVVSNLAIEAARKIGKVTVDMNGTACKVPDAEPYIEKMLLKGRMGKKKKQARC